MKRFFSRLRDRIYLSTGMYQLGEGFAFFALVHTAFLIFTSMQGVFINTLFIRLTGDSDIVMRYNIIINCFSGPMMLCSALFARRSSPTFSLRIGILFHISMYITFFLAMDHLSTFMPIIAAFAGIGNGFYWFSYSYIINVYSTDQSRDLAVSLIGVLAGVVSLTMPALAGAVIPLFDGIIGYAVMFGFSLFMAVVTILVSGKMQKIPPQDRKSHLKPLLQLALENRLYALSLFGETFKCLREGVCAFLFNVLLFQAITNEAIVGVNTLLAGVASIAGSFAYGKLVSSKNRIQSMAVSTTILLALACTLFLQLSPVTIILYSVINAVLGTFLMNPTFSISYALVLGSKRSRAALPEFIGLRECMISLGRIIGISFTMLLPKSTIGYVSAIVALTAMQYVTTLIQRTVKNNTPAPESEAD